MRIFLVPVLALMIAMTVLAEDRPPIEIIRSQYRIEALKTRELGPQLTMSWFGAVGTATAISKRQLLCCAHEIHNPDGRVMINLFDEDGLEAKSITAKIGKIDKEKDLCLLEAEDDLPFFVDVNKNQRKLVIGDNAYCVGSRMGQTPYAVSKGSYAAKEMVKFPGLSLFTMQVFGGNSGGGVYETDGNTLIGIVHGYFAEAEGEAGAFSLCIQISTIRDFLKPDEEEDD